MNLNLQENNSITLMLSSPICNSKLIALVLKWELFGVLRHAVSCCDTSCLNYKKFTVSIDNISLTNIILPFTIYTADLPSDSSLVVQGTLHISLFSLVYGHDGSWTWQNWRDSDTHVCLGERRFKMLQPQNREWDIPTLFWSTSVIFPRWEYHSRPLHPLSSLVFQRTCVSEIKTETLETI